MRLVKKKTNVDPALGRSQGGFSTKLHAAVDALGNPVRFVLTAGQRGDCPQAKPLLAQDKPGAVLADKAYDANWLVALLQEKGAEVVIPSRSNAKQPRQIDENLYKDRNKVERFFNRIKHYRRVATRYDKTARNYLATVYIASIITLML